MTDLLRDFAIDGTGRVVRPGDVVIVSPISFSRITGLTRIVSVLGDKLRVATADGIESNVPSHLVHRADDTERTPGGAPLWCWM